jgi:predicted TIM-barrel fold metal-dependent hydrolase
MQRAALVVVTAVLAAAMAGAQTPAGRGGQGTPVVDRASPQGRGRGIQIQPGAECPPGTTLVRVGVCQAPEFPPPSIVDYRPTSTLAVEQHPVPRAKFPVVDIHSHVEPTAQTIDQVVKEMDSLNLRVLVLANNESGSELQQTLATIRNSAHKDRFRALAGIDFRNVGPGWGAKAVAQLEADLKVGAVGVGEIPKQAGMTIKKADGSRLRIDDPELDPVWNAMARLGLPVFLHTADPEEFFHQPDMHNERWLELSLFPDRRWYLNKDFTFQQLLAERDALFKKHPKTKFIVAHFGWQAAKLGELGKMLDAYPNTVTEMGAILYDLGRQPRTAHDFFVKYQDRILFGKDAYAPSEYPYFWRVLETRDEYFDYYRDYHAFWNLYGMDLPDAVLRKVYYQNALRVTPGLPQRGW